MPLIPREVHILIHLVNLASGLNRASKINVGLVILRLGINMVPVYNSATAWSRNSSAHIYLFNFLNKQR